MPDLERGPVSLSGLPSGGLVGRAAESAAIQRTLGRARLVTVTGPPGAGKTAVGIATAARLSPRFADGAWLVRLDSLRDGSRLPDTIAKVLKVPGGLTGGRLDALVDYLSDRCLLLVLDTCEHLAGACAEIACVSKAAAVTPNATAKLVFMPLILIPLIGRPSSR